MATVYLQRDAAGAITGVYAKATPGLAEEAADDASAEVQAFLYPPDLSNYRRAGAGRRARRFAPRSTATRSRPSSSGPKPTPIA